MTEMTTREVPPDQPGERPHARRSGKGGLLQQAILCPPLQQGGEGGFPPFPEARFSALLWNRFTLGYPKESPAEAGF